ncbi:MAG: carboxypeptidase-like regulatory domain-containing protein [Bacteroidetes bacterium]|nr:carboxypeptidase-like regulatory domain-containing protein [Bacteroidota bacterium]MCY4204527.1 carboxypeptidase-like regulatory domain-containing protein [Bacteroidota bacterium]
MIYRFTILFSLAFLFSSVSAFAQTGKIAGVVVDQNDDPLPGGNVVIDGGTIGAVTDVDGAFSILSVRPGIHTLRATFIGFTSLQLMEDMVSVRIILTRHSGIFLDQQTGFQCQF